MAPKIDRIDSVNALPDAWDVVAENCFQRREFLSHCERYNPCNQRYYCLVEGSELLAGAVVYTLPVDLLTFSGIKSRIRMHVAGVPCSVSSAGILGDRLHWSSFLKQILKYEKGFFLCLNLPASFGCPSMIAGRTFPTIEFANSFSSWDEYVKSLRSHYRRRLSAIEDFAANVQIRTAPCCTSFREEFHTQYESVYHRSVGKLEKLSAGFFHNLPIGFNLTTYSIGDEVCGWSITVADKPKKFYFFLGGQNYSCDSSNIYLVKLMTILKLGLASGVEFIDFGQTAEIPKLRFGGRIREKKILAYHNNPLARSLLTVGRSLLSYNRHVPETNCFTENRPC